MAHEEFRSLGSEPRGSCRHLNIAGEHLAREVGEAVHPEPDVQAVRADAHALDQQRDDAWLLSGGEFLPQRVEPIPDPATTQKVGPENRSRDAS